MKLIKLYFLFFCFLIFSLSAFSQIDNQKKSISIPAVKSEKDSASITALKPISPLDNKSQANGLNAPKLSTNIEIPKKEFSMFGEKFGNPGELYTKQVNKNLANVKLPPEEVEQLNGSKTDQYFGDFKSNAKYVKVVYRDHGYVDGDIIQVLVNDDVIHARVFLSGGFKGFKLDLQPGFNKIDFLALNQGESGPNTAEFKVVDDTGKLVSSNRWNLATGVKATVIIVKE